MNAIVYHSYGSADVLRNQEIERPVPGNHEVLIEVRAASVNPLDCGELKGLPYLFRLIFGLHRAGATQPGRPGVDLAGRVHAVGRNVTRFKPGDEVFGVCITDPNAKGLKVWAHSQGSFAEYASVPETALALKPANMSYEQAASVPIAGLTALQGLHDKGHLQPGKSVLIHGAGGGVGTFAVQIAKALGAEVTAVTRTENAELLRSIGADRVIDYTQVDFTQESQHFDLIFDCHASRSLRACRSVLKPGGVYVGIGAPSRGSGPAILGRLLEMPIWSLLGSRKLTTLLARPNKADLATLSDLMAAGKVTPVIDRCFSLREVPDAIRYLESGQARGKVVVTVR